MLRSIRKNIIGRHFSLVKKIFGQDSIDVQSGKEIKLQNYVNGSWKDAQKYEDIINPLNGKPMYKAPLVTTDTEIDEFIEDLKLCPKGGLHNPFKNPKRYREWGEALSRVVEILNIKEVNDHFVKTMQMVMPKSDVQVQGEITVTKRFLENFCGDVPRLNLRGFNVAGDYEGQISNGYRFPYGPVAIISPFNFPLEIPVLQTIGAMIAGNKVLLKTDSRVALVMQDFIKLLDYCEVPSGSLSLINTNGICMERLLLRSGDIIRNTQFTGSSKVAERLSEILRGKVKIEDAGFNWKIFGSDVHDIDYVAYQCDKDAYAASGQKCSATSLIVCHENWEKAGLIDKIKTLAEKRTLKNLTASPVLTWSNQRIQAHVDSVLAVPGAKLLFGGAPLEENHNVPSVYGSYKPTAVYVPLETLFNPQYHDLLTTELFGPFQIVTSYTEKNLPRIFDFFNSLHFHLTAAVVSNNVQFINHVIKNTVNGVTYVGIRGRTTGAPQNHWFGSSNDPRGTGIGTTEGILLTWTCHREIVNDFGSYGEELKSEAQS